MPRITRVTVGASRKFNDPVESYANHSASVTLDAEVTDGESYEEAVRSLQQAARALVDADHDRIVAAANAAYEERLERDRKERDRRLAETRTRKLVPGDDEDDDRDFEEDEDEPF